MSSASLSPTADFAASPRISGSTLIAVALLCQISFIAYVQRLSISITANPIGSEMHFNEWQLGAIMAAFGWGYALFQIPAGWITDAWGSRRTLSMAALGWSVGVGCLAAANGFWSIWWLWFTVGMIQSAVFSCATRGLRDWLPARVWAKGNGALTSSMYLGGGITIALTPLLLYIYSWREINLLYAALGVTWAALFASWFRNSPSAIPTAPVHGDLESNNDSSLNAASPLTTLSILGIPAVWALIAQQFFRCAAYVFFTTWFPIYLLQSHSVNLATSGALASMPLFATLIGCLAGGYFADWLFARTGSLRVSRQGIAVPGMLISGVAIAVSLAIDNALLAVIMISIGAWGSAFTGVAAFTTTLDLGRDRVGTLFSLMNTAGNVGGALFPMIVGAVIQRTGNWTIIVWLCAGLYFMAALCWMVLNPSAASSSTHEATANHDTPLLPMPADTSPRPDSLALAAVPLIPDGAE